MSFIIFITVFLSVFAFQTYIIKKRLIDKLAFKDKTKKYLSIFLYITFFGVCMYPVARYNPVFPNWLYFLLSLPIGVIFLTFIITIIHKIISYGVKKCLDIGTISLIVETNAKAMQNAKTIELKL